MGTILKKRKDIEIERRVKHIDALVALRSTDKTRYMQELEALVAPIVAEILEKQQKLSKTTSRKDLNSEQKSGITKLGGHIVYALKNTCSGIIDVSTGLYLVTKSFLKRFCVQIKFVDNNSKDISHD